MNASEYLTSHAIDPSVALKCGLYEDGNTLVIPYKDKGFERRRSLVHKATWQPAGQPLSLYWPYKTKEMRAVLLCEGESDTLAAISALKSLVVIPVGIPGVGMPPERVALQLAAHDVKRVWLALDGDEAGQRATDNIALALTRAGMKAKRVEIPKDRDLSDCLASLGPGFLTAALKASKPAMTDELRARLYASLSPAEQTQGVTPKHTFEGLRSQHSASEDPLRSVPATTYVPHLLGTQPNDRGYVHCPFHEDKTPSFKVYEGDGGFYCFGACQWGGGIYDLAMKLWNCDFKQAKERLEQTFDVVPQIEGQTEIAA